MCAGHAMNWTVNYMLRDVNYDVTALFRVLSNHKSLNKTLCHANSLIGNKIN